MQKIEIMRTILTSLLLIYILLQRKINKLLLDERTFLKLRKEFQSGSLRTRLWIKKYYRVQGDIVFFVNSLSIAFFISAIILFWLL